MNRKKVHKGFSSDDLIENLNRLNVFVWHEVKHHELMLCECDFTRFYFRGKLA